MTRNQMLNELRQVIDDEVAPYGWADPTLLGYLAEGQDKFCEDTGFFKDVVTYTVETVAGTASYSLSDRIISVIDVFDGTRRLGHFQEVDKYPQTPPGAPFDLSATTSPSNSWQADYAAGYITLYPTPVDVRTLTLRVWRYSLYDLSGDDPSGDPVQPELPARLQRACVEWAAYKALMHHDRELQDPVKAGTHLTAYRAYVTDGKKAARRGQSVDYRIGGNQLYVVR